MSSIDPQDKVKLNSIISNRKLNMSSIVNFEEMFLKFSRVTLRESVEEINIYLQEETFDLMKIMYDDPYESNSSLYFVQIKLFININNSQLRTNQWINSRNAEPTLRFNGKPSDGIVEVAYRLSGETHFSIQSRPKVIELIPEFISGIIIDFIAQVYK